MNCNLKPIQNYFGYVNFRMSKIFYFEITKQKTFTRAQRKLKGLLCGSAHTFEPLNAIIIFGAIESWSLLKRKNVFDQVMRCDTMRWSSWRRCCCVEAEVLSSQWKWSRSWNFPHMNWTGHTFGFYGENYAQTGFHPAMWFLLFLKNPVSWRSFERSLGS